MPAETGYPIVLLGGYTDQQHMIMLNRLVLALTQRLVELSADVAGVKERVARLEGGIK